VPGLNELTAGFIRGAGGQDIELQLGDSGPLFQLVARAIATDTDAEPVELMPIVADMPSRIITNGFNGFSGSFEAYFVFS